jgi:hypothetical protein
MKAPRAGGAFQQGIGLIAGRLFFYRDGGKLSVKRKNIFAAGVAGDIATGLHSRWRLFEWWWGWLVLLARRIARAAGDRYRAVLTAAKTAMMWIGSFAD